MSPNEILPEKTRLSVVEQEALELRTAGMTYQQIADRQNVDVSTAHRRVQRVLEWQRQQAYEMCEDVRDFDLAKLAWIERRLMVEAVEGDRGATRLLIDIIECRKRYLAALPPKGPPTEMDVLNAGIQKMLKDIAMSNMFSDGPKK